MRLSSTTRARNPVSFASSAAGAPVSGTDGVPDATPNFAVK
jgi:hypothetical protein